jgi:hypothetical protein
LFFFSPPLALVLVVLGLAFAPVVGFWRRWSTTLGASAAGAVTGAVLGWGTVAVLVGVVAVLGGVLAAGVVDVVVEGCGVVAPASGAPAPGVVTCVVEPSVETGGIAGVLAPIAPLARGPPKPAAVSPPPATAESIARHARRRALRGDMR